MYNIWIQKSGTGFPGRENAVAFAIGGDGYVGGGSSGVTVYKDFWKYDSSTDSWSQVADIGGGAAPVRTKAIGFSIGLKGYVGCGEDAGSIKLKDFYEYDSTGNSWTTKANFDGDARIDAVGFSINDKGYVGTGATSGGRTKDFWEYVPTSNTWNNRIDFPSTAITKAIGFNIGGRGYVGTGETSGGAATTMYEYDQDTGLWTATTPFSGSYPIDMVAFNIGAKAYVGCGEDSGGTRSIEFWEYDPNVGAGGTWTQKLNFGGSARTKAIGFAIGVKGFIGAGNAATGDKNDFWEYASYLDTPTNLTITYLSPTSISLNWIDNSTEETNYIIERKRSDQVVYSTLATTTSPPGSGTMDYTDNTVDLYSYGYWYRLRAFKLGII